MNKDKIIKDLKERNDKLKNQYVYLEIRFGSLEYRYNKQKEVLDKIKEKVNQYELIKGYYDYIEENGYVETTSHDTLKEDILELLEEIE